MNNSNFFPLERNRYFYGKMLTARDFETEQRYFNNKRRLLNRTLYGAGVVCGLGVYRNDDVSDSAQRSGDNFDKDIYNVPWRDQNEHVASDFNYMTVVCK